MLTAVEINPGDLCNNRCVFCMNGYERDEHKPWAPRARVLAELRAWRAKGVRAVGFVGGEPTVYPHLLEAVAAARSLGYRSIALCTNGVRLSEPGFCRRLVEAGVTRIALSVHSCRPEVEEGLVGVPGVLAKKVRAVRNLTALRDAGRLPGNVSLNPVLCRANLRELADYGGFFRGLGINDIRFNFIWPQGRVRRDPGVVPRYAEAVPWMLAFLRENERRLGLRAGFGAVPPCVLPEALRRRSALTRRYFGDPDAALERHNAAFSVDTGRFERSGWVEHEGGDYKAHVPACGTCRLRPGCDGVWKTYLELYGAGEFRPIP